MWAFIKPINLIRYLIFWRINRTLVRLPRCTPAELSLVLGTIIANRLPTREASPWRKALAPWDDYQGKGLNLPRDATPGNDRSKLTTIPEAAWPIEAVLFVYPGKMSYGQDEVIVWELKLLGDRADHGFFLEFILPAMEEAGSTSNPQWHHQHSPWGRFDIDAVYAARGAHWEPLVQRGQLDLRYQPTPTQWAEGLTFGLTAKRVFRRLTWLTPFDLGETLGSINGSGRPAHKKQIPPPEVPTLQSIIEALLARMARLLPGKYNTPGDVWNILSPEDQAALFEAVGRADDTRLRGHELISASKYWPGRWIGQQTFSAIPPLLIPYLELASILHVGKQTHFGCGTFIIT
jgi:hypothetical protein